MKAIAAWLGKLEPKWVASNVVGWGFLAAVLLCHFFYSSLPMQERTFKLMDKVAETNARLTDIQATQTPILEDIRKNTAQSVVASGRER